MLGGSVLIAFIRFAVSLAGTVALYSLMSRPRFNIRKTVLGYVCFSTVLISLACVWYVVDWQSCKRISAFAMFCCFGIFAIWMSDEHIYLSLYKLALTFYLLAVFLIGGIEISILFFDRNVWADIVTRIVLIIAISLFIEKKIKNSIREFGYYVENELDKFSVTVMIISILFGIGFILRPDSADFGETPFRLFQILINFFLTGALQLLIFRLYHHIGKEIEYQKENQLMKMNQRLLQRNMEILADSVEESRRIRHDVRHHIAVIGECARRGQKEELIHYLKEYEKTTDESMEQSICANTAVNNLLSAYTKKAKKEHIEVDLDIEMKTDITISDMDLITILANAYENAIYACIEVKKKSDDHPCRIYLAIKTKKNKLSIYCRNTCKRDAAMKNGLPKSEFTGGIGVLSIIKTADKYDGEYDFKIENGEFIFRMIINIPPIKDENRERADYVSDSNL